MNSRTPVATWSLRERPVCRRLPASPIRSVSTDSTFMCTSSSDTRHSKAPASMSARMASSPETMASRSASLSTPTSASIVACAIEPRMSCFANR